jgi:plastocyanin
MTWRAVRESATNGSRWPGRCVRTAEADSAPRPADCRDPVGADPGWLSLASADGAICRAPPVIRSAVRAVEQFVDTLRRLNPGAPTRTSRRRRAPALAFAGVLGLGLAACGGATTAAQTAPAKTPAPSNATAKGATGTSSGHATIIIKNFAFHPALLDVKPGERITVHNEDPVTHTVTSTTHAFNTGDVSPGATVTFTAPMKAGTYPYICVIHPFMHGTLHVS